jgi:hypothetical protein
MRRICLYQNRQSHIFNPQCPLAGLFIRCMLCLTLSPTAPYDPPCRKALGLIGPRKKEKKLVLMTSARSDWT